MGLASWPAHYLIVHLKMWLILFYATYYVPVGRYQELATQRLQ